jgi:uncharacterized membrane protein YhhN
MNVSHKFPLFFVPLCLLYLLISSSLAAELSAVVKILPILLLAFLVVRTGLPSGTVSKATSIYLLIALFFSMGGDVLLEVGHFVPGLVSFLTAQIAYAVLFTKNYSNWNKNLPVSVAIIVFALGMSWLMWGSAGEMRIPVLGYLTVISFMGLTAASSSIKGVTLGALTFMASDSFIAINRFVTEVPASGPVVMISYYLAQYLLIVSVLNSKELNSENDA